MSLPIKAVSTLANHATPCLVIPVINGALTAQAQSLDNETLGTINKLLKRGDLGQELGATLLLPLLASGKAERILLSYVGDDAELTSKSYQQWLEKTLAALQQLQLKSASLLLEDIQVKEQSRNWMLQRLGQLKAESHYHYQKTLSKPKASSSLKTLTLITKSNKGLKESIEAGIAIGLGANTAKELGNLPGNICTPTYLANQAKALGRKHKALSVKIIDEKAMREMGMGSLLSVTAGSKEPAKLIVMEYRGGKKKDHPHVLVGKGITFDTGGISLKPGAKMDEMKYDMCGAASVLGTMTTVTELSLDVNIVGIIAAAENMPSGNATKPGDVVTSMSGKTIEVLNTDAEGRLVLCDALTFAERFKPKSVIDIATLTGACVVALGKHATGLYSNDDEFAKTLIATGEKAGDRAWQMPLWDDYQPQLNSNFADMANIGGPEGGSITAACFLSRFAENFCWAHLDIAGTAWNSGANKGATGRPVALLSQYLIDQSTTA